MPGGRRNPVSFSNIVDQIHGAVEKAKANAHDVTSLTKGFAEHNIRFVDLEIQVSYGYRLVLCSRASPTLQFIGASGIPKMDVVGSADPYFIAKIDDKISFVHVSPTKLLASH